jgi:hypothetical protein
VDVLENVSLATSRSLHLDKRFKTVANIAMDLAESESGLWRLRALVGERHREKQPDERKVQKAKEGRVKI